MGTESAPVVKDGGSRDGPHLFTQWSLVCLAFSLMLGSMAARAKIGRRISMTMSGRPSAPEPLAPPLTRAWVYEPPFPPAQGWERPYDGYGVIKNADMVSDDDSYRVVSAGDAAYFASSAENRIYAVDAASGKIRWTFFTAAPPRYAPSLSGGKVYFGSDDGVVYCLNAADGKVLWQVNAAPTPEKMIGQGRMISLWPVVPA